jgi:hypothetical protein
MVQVIRIGGVACNLKKDVGHGNWRPFLKAHKDKIKLSQDSLQNYMRIYEKREQIRSAPIFPQMSIREAIRYLDEQEAGQADGVTPEDNGPDSGPDEGNGNENGGPGGNSTPGGNGATSARVGGKNVGTKKPTARKGLKQRVLLFTGKESGRWDDLMVWAKHRYGVAVDSKAALKMGEELRKLVDKNGAAKTAGANGANGKGALSGQRSSANGRARRKEPKRR